MAMLRIKKLRLKNFRGFENISIDFSEHITCIAGINGTGKTTILSALERSMLIFLNKNHLSKYYSRKYALNAVDVRLAGEDSFLTKTSTAETEMTFSLDGQDAHIKHSFFKQGASGKYHSATYGGSGFVNAESCPIFAFYSINRRNSSIEKQRKYKYSASIFAAWENVNLLNFDCFYAWFKDEQLDEYQKRENLNTYESKQLKAVKLAIDSFFDGKIKLKIHNGRLMAVKGNIELLFQSFSDGEKSLVYILADIARRLAIANEKLDNPLEGSGVVLIDEIEMHLHPSWQRKICSILVRTFPNCQFVITTHSPQVLGELQPQDIRLLSNFAVSVPSQSFGLDSNSILDTLQNDTNLSLRQNAHVSEKLDEISGLIDEGNLSKARDELRSLEKELNGSTTETVSLETEIALMEDAE